MPPSVDQALRKAKRHARKGETDLAAQQYKSVLEKFPKNQRAIEGLKTLQQPRALKTANNPGPGPSQAQINGLIALYNQGKLRETLVQGQALAKQFPNVPFIPNLLGAANAGLGRLEQAVASYAEALRIQPDVAEAHNNLGAVLVDLGKPDQAADSYAKALQINPDYAEAHNNLGNVLNDLGRPEEAVASYHKALRIKPDYAKAHYNLGNALNDLGKSEEAVDSFNKAVQIAPEFAEAHNNLGSALNDLGRLEEAVAVCNRALQTNADFAEAHRNLGNALSGLGKSEEAASSLNRALQIKPDYAEAHNNLGSVLNDLGKREEAVASYGRALQIKPDYSLAHYNLSTAKKFQDGDPQTDQMLELVERQSLPDEDRIYLSFALGKAHGDVGNHDKAFLYLLDGNRLRKQALQYDGSAARARIAKIKSTFAEDVTVGNVFEESDGAPGHQPVFIVGMPRSGTTLVEQILASHSQVYGAGELEVLRQLVDTVEWNATQLSSDQLLSIRKSYLSSLNEIGASEPYVTDKMPLNFWWIGFIFAAMPEARIVHVRRDARATCWSNFKHYFPGAGIDFAYDLRDVAEYYKMYVAMMAFWNEKFPGRIYDLNYEALTERQEDETRALLEYVGLSWEDQCLEFHTTKRAVRTASATQVRQKMYRGSSEEWRKYEKHLEPMVEVLRGF